jgi:multidrug efflux pump subunit AcrA (membrane-fusion protein)
MRRALLYFLLFCGAAFSAPEKPKAPVVFVETLRSRELFDQLMYPARIIPKINATVLSESDGIVRKISTPLGHPVARNQTILTLTNTDPVYHFAPMVVTSPVRGVVSSVEVTEGSRVMRGQKLATITDPSQIHIALEVAVPDLGSVRPGLQGELRLAGGETPVPVKVRGISPFVDPATGTASCELELADPKKSPPLPAGFVGQVTFKAREHKGFELPESAVVYRGRDPFVRVVVNNKAKLVPITLGETRQGLVEITRGPKEGDQVVIRASKFVADGEEVTLQRAGAE